MAAGVLLDTSFFITLADPKRQNHQTARRYWRYFTEQKIPLFLSTIVVSEFCLRQQFPAEILGSCIVLPFNWDDALLAAELDFTTFTGPRESRVALKDDVKIIAQAGRAEAIYIVTDDEDTLVKFAKAAKSAGKINCDCIALKDGFDRAFFEKGQKDFEDQLGESEDS
jgi:predicted nucleic acid-binding protein